MLELGPLSTYPRPHRYYTETLTAHMGQRHQAFLIARVRPYGVPPEHPGNRRCIAAFHHQWCYGILPLRAMWRLVNLVSQPENAAIIRAEIRALDGKYGGHGREKPTISEVPCPYTASLLGCAWTTQLGDKDEFYSSGVTLEHALLPAGMDCWAGGEYGFPNLSSHSRRTHSSDSRQQ